MALADGTVRSWGDNVFGNLGDGTPVQPPNPVTPNPVTVSGLSDVRAVGAGDWSSFAITNSGALYAWGRNNSGQLGDGTTTDRTTPVLVPGISDVVEVTGNESMTAARVTRPAPCGPGAATGPASSVTERPRPASPRRR